MKQSKAKEAFSWALPMLMAAVVFFLQWKIFNHPTLWFSAISLGISVLLFIYSFLQSTKIGISIWTKFFGKNNNKINNDKSQKGCLLIVPTKRTAEQKAVKKESIAKEEAVSDEKLWSSEGFQQISIALLVALAAFFAFVVGYSYGNWWPLTFIVVAGVIFGITYYKKWGDIGKSLGDWVENKALPTVGKGAKKAGFGVWKIFYTYVLIPFGNALIYKKGEVLLCLSWFTLLGSICFIVGNEKSTETFATLLGVNLSLMALFILIGIAFFFFLFSAPARKKNAKIKTGG